VWDSLTATPAPTYLWATTKWVGDNHMTNINYPFICTLRLKMSIILTCQEIKHYQILTKKNIMFASSELSRNQTLSNFVRKSNIILTCQEIKHHPNLSQ